jgi:hypothetical protein
MGKIQQGAASAPTPTTGDISTQQWIENLAAARRQAWRAGGVLVPDFEGHKFAISKPARQPPPAEVDRGQAQVILCQPSAQSSVWAGMSV